MNRRLGAHRVAGGTRSETNVVAHADPAPPWWANPAVLIGAFILPLFMLVFLVPTVFGRGSIVLNARVYFDWPYFGLGVAFFATMLVGALLGTYLRPAPPSPRAARESRVSEGYLEALGLLSIAAYMIWFRGMVTSPSDLVALFTGGGADIRGNNQTIGGVTTLAQCGIAYSILYLDQLWGTRVPFRTKRPHWYFAIIVVWTVFRVYAWAERLALIELAVPIGLLFFCYRTDVRWRVVSAIRRFGPFLGLGAMLLYFGATEYSRSWNAHYQYSEDSFWDFVTRRFLTYYYTALNNGAGLLQNYDWPTYQADHVLQWLYRFPVSIGPIFRYTFDVESVDTRFLFAYADREFSNMSGLFTVYFDLGIGGALVYAALWGATIGYAYSCVKARTGFWRLLYPLLFVAILEAMRVPYLGEPRAIPPVFALAIGYLLFRPAVRRPDKAFTRTRGRARLVSGGGLGTWVGAWRRG